MKLLNSKEVKRGYGIFSMWLLVLLIAGCMCVQSYRWLEEMETRYFRNTLAALEEKRTTQQFVEERLDTLYRHFQLLGGGQVLHEDRLREYIHKRINSLDTSGGNNADPVTDTLIRESRQAALNMLIEKDSIALLMKEEAALREQLLKCLEQNKSIKMKMKE